MRIKGAKQVHYEAGPNMVPLVDVVMVILIFLMLTGSFGLTSHFFRSQAPVERTGKGRPEANPKLPEPKILLNVMSETGAYAKVDGFVMKNIEDLAKHMGEVRARYADCDKDGNPKPEDPRQPPPTVQLMPAGHHDYEAIIEAYQVVVACKFPKIGFKMVPERAPAATP